MAGVPGGTKLGEAILGGAEPHAISEGRGAVTARLHKTDIGNLNHGYVAFLVEASHGKSREPQHLLDFGQAFGNLDIRIRRRVGVIVVLEGEQFSIVYGLVGKVHAQFVDAARRSNQPVPAPERWRKR